MDGFNVRNERFSYYFYRIEKEILISQVLGFDFFYLTIAFYRNKRRVPYLFRGG